MRRALLIVNPFSTNVTDERVVEIERVLRERVELETRRTEAPGHATELAAEAAGRRDIDALLVFSGDGTYNEALNGADGAVPYGFLPGGGTSVFPRALGLPRDSLAAAVAVAAAIDEGRERRISLGRVNGRRFCFSAGIGFDGEAVRRLDALGRDDTGARPGDVAFLREVARMLVARRATWKSALEIEGHGRAAFVLVANGDPYTYAGNVPLHVAPDAEFELGLDFVAPEHVGPAAVPRFAAMLVRGRGQMEALDVRTGHDLDRIVVRCDRPLPLQADGEDLGDVEEAIFTAERDAISVLV